MHDSAIWNKASKRITNSESDNFIFIVRSLAFWRDCGVCAVNGDRLCTLRTAEFGGTLQCLQLRIWITMWVIILNAFWCIAQPAMTHPEHPNLLSQQCWLSQFGQRGAVTFWNEKSIFQYKKANSLPYVKISSINLIKIQAGMAHLLPPKWIIKSQKLLSRVGSKKWQIPKI